LLIHQVRHGLSPLKDSCFTQFCITVIIDVYSWIDILYFPNHKIVPFHYFVDVEKRGIYILRVTSSKDAALGIGAMIVFIAMVLVASLAAYVLLSTSSQLQMKSSTTGGEAIKEAATGLKIDSIEGHNTSGLIDKVIIDISPRPGSQDIDLSTAHIELSNGSAKCVFKYSESHWVNRKTGSMDVFAEHAFSSVASEYGLIVMADADDSCGATTPVINDGDSVYLAINTTACFHGIAHNTNVEGNVIPESGAWGIIQFRTPSSFTTPIIILQQD
jgi:flagellin FlaB